MKKRILRYFKHLLLTIVTLLVVAIIFGLSIGASATFGENPMMMNMDKDGPYVFFKNDSTLSVNYLKGRKRDGFSVDSFEQPLTSKRLITCYHPLDSTHFSFTMNDRIQQPPISYEDNQPVLAISDIEGNYLTFRDFLIKNGVINEQLSWTFGKGHLVLVGDFVDRGYFVTQVLWFIYKLEQDAAEAGGRVHFIIGNHELKTMEGNYMSAAIKYFFAAALLGKQQYELYTEESVIGRWLASKNAMEKINGNLFVHGGIHPDIAQSRRSIDNINQIIRESYGQTYYPKPDSTFEQLVRSTETGPCWYRGYFKDDLTEEQIDDQLEAFDVNTIVVGHTLNWKVKSLYNEKVIGIDVKHPQDHRKSWPNNGSQGLLIENGQYFRLSDSGERTEL
jgi:hypothetical protein